MREPLTQDNSSVRVIGQLNQLSITNNPIGVEVTGVSSAGLFLGPSIEKRVRPLYENALAISEPVVVVFDRH